MPQAFQATSLLLCCPRNQGLPLQPTMLAIGIGTSLNRSSKNPKSGQPKTSGWQVSDHRPKWPPHLASSLGSRIREPLKSAAWGLPLQGRRDGPLRLHSPSMCSPVGRGPKGSNNELSILTWYLRWGRDPNPGRWTVTNRRSQRVLTRRRLKNLQTGA
jgi:hypothetical protein